MRTQTNRIYCSARQTPVDVSQGFEKCIVDHQCFSDDPCPLAGKFAEPVASPLLQKGRTQPAASERVTAQRKKMQ